MRLQKKVSHMTEQWFIRREDQDEGPLTKDEILAMQKTGKLAAKDFVRAPGKSDWQHAIFIKGLFGEGNEMLLDFTADRMTKVSPERLQDTAVTLSEIAAEQGTSRQDIRRALWLRGDCQRLMARNADSLEEVIALFQSAQNDYSQAVTTDPGWFAGKMLSREGRWFPENPVFIPAYLAFLASRTGSSLEMGFTAADAARALGKMGKDASDARSALELLKSQWACIPFVEWALQRISTPVHQQELNETQMLLARVSEELEAYAKHCVEAPRIEYDNEHPLTKEDVACSESELVSQLGNKNWVVRVKSACILRCKVESPNPETLRVLFQHLDTSEKRGEVRGECALTLGHFSSLGSLKAGMLDKFVNVLLERLDHDTAYPVRAIAAEFLVRFGNHLHEVVASLIATLSKPQKLNLERALVAALGECGPAAEKALPLVLRFTPHRNDSTGQIIKAATILRIAPADHPESQTSLKTVVANLRWQPIAKPAGIPRECRAAALKAIRSIPTDELLRKKLLLERLYFDDSARLRCDAARALIAIDKDLATKVGAYLVLDRIGT